MTRLSDDELRGGHVWNGFDDALQVWVVDGVAQCCGHPGAIRRTGPCCPAFSLAGRRIETIPGAQRRRPTAGDGVESSGTNHRGPRTEA